MSGTAVTFRCGDLNLEGRLYLPPRTESRDRIPGVALCHPHPLYGGNMDSSIIVAVSRALSRAGMAALRFNFRGVGRSRGFFDNGSGEQDDARAALDHLAACREVDAGRLGLLGYSFGGMVALNTGRHQAIVRALAAVSPVFAPGILQGYDRPVLLICGTEDHLVSAQDLRREAAGMIPSGKVEMVQGADHFWWGYEQEAARSLVAFFSAVFGSTTHT